VNGTGSESCPVASLGIISGVAPSSSTITEEAAVLSPPHCLEGLRQAPKRLRSMSQVSCSPWGLSE
jgi:hypothetical protein